MNSGPGAGPVLLNNVSCTHDSTEISQCVHPLSIGIHYCSKTHMAGVKCQRIVSSSTVQLQSLATSYYELSQIILYSILDISNSASLTHECIHLTTPVFPMVSITIPSSLCKPRMIIVIIYCSRQEQNPPSHQLQALPVTKKLSQEYSF